MSEHVRKGHRCASGSDPLLSPGDDEAGRGDVHPANPEDWANVDPTPELGNSPNLWHGAEFSGLRMCRSVARHVRVHSDSVPTSRWRRLGSRRMDRRRATGCESACRRSPLSARVALLRSTADQGKDAGKRVGGRHPTNRIRSALTATGSAWLRLRVEPFRVQILIRPCPEVTGDRVVVDSFHG